MRGLSSCLVALALASVTGCGARSSIGAAGSGPSATPADHHDAAPSPGDSTITRPRDGCLPIPAAEVSHTYEGEWEGQVRCPDQIYLSGIVSLSLVPASDPESFAVAGSMRGQVVAVDPPIWFSADVTGAMSCTALSATMRIAVGHDRGPAIALRGALQGSFSAAPRGFSGGAWTIEQAAGERCAGNGRWSALAVR